MDCEKCGAKIQDGFKFCQKCGAPVIQVPNNKETANFRTAQPQTEDTQGYTKDGRRLSRDAYAGAQVQGSAVAAADVQKPVKLQMSPKWLIGAAVVVIVILAVLLLRGCSFGKYQFGSTGKTILDKNYTRNAVTMEAMGWVVPLPEDFSFHQNAMYIASASDNEENNFLINSLDADDPDDLVEAVRAYTEGVTDYTELQAWDNLKVDGHKAAAVLYHCFDDTYQCRLAVQSGEDVVLMQYTEQHADGKTVASRVLGELVKNSRYEPGEVSAELQSRYENVLTQYENAINDVDSLGSMTAYIYLIESATDSFYSYQPQNYAEFRAKQAMEQNIRQVEEDISDVVAQGAAVVGGELFDWALQGIGELIFG